MTRLIAAFACDCESSYNHRMGPKYSPPPPVAFPLGCLHAATTPASKGLGAANLLIVA